MRVPMAVVTIEQAEKKILQALSKEGGELTRSELVLTTRMPYNMVIRVLGKLEHDERVKVSSSRISGLETILLA